MEKISFIIPCYKSEKTITKVIEEIVAVVSQREYDYEIIAVNDASPDLVLQVLLELIKENPRIKVIDLAINAGQQAAMMAGMQYMSGDYAIFLDDDYQCPTDHLWELLQPLYEGADVSCAKYGYKSESLFRNFGSWLNDLMYRSLLHKPKDLQLSNFVAVKRFVVDKMLEYKNPYPYVDGLLLRTTSRIVNVAMNDRKRLYGKSNYTLAKLIKLVMNGFTSFSIKPLRIATVSGIFCSIGGLIFMIYIIVSRLVRNDIDAGYSSIMAVNLFIGGCIMMLLGMIGEYVGRMYICLNNSPQYVVRKAYNIENNTKTAERMNGYIDEKEDQSQSIGNICN